MGKGSTFLRRAVFRGIQLLTFTAALVLKVGSGQHCRVSTAVLGFIFSNVTGLVQIMSVAVIYCRNKAV